MCNGLGEGGKLSSSRAARRGRDLFEGQRHGAGLKEFDPSLPVSFLLSLLSLRVSLRQITHRIEILTRGIVF